MRRPRSLRLFAAFFAPWFAVVVAEPVPVHECPMHSLHPAAVHSPASENAAAGGAGQSMDMAAQAGHEERAPSHRTHKQCCCLDQSCATPLAPLSRAPGFALVPVAIRSEIVPARKGAVALAAAGHILPFANGPPVLLA